MDYVAPDVVACMGPEWVEGSEYRGHEGLRSLLSVWTDRFDDWTVRDLELREAGDSVVALFEHDGRVKVTQTTISQRIGARVLRLPRRPPDWAGPLLSDLAGGSRRRRVSG